ncbi:MAG: hypothetical protein M1828_000602 [Chrysothrix sp. TS-e1954]|nr:MAG: hypothetical protein M1828_000602 [Chrysothrix sp. TS-e1954]
MARTVKQSPRHDSPLDSSLFRRLKIPAQADLSRTPLSHNDSFRSPSNTPAQHDEPVNYPTPESLIDSDPLVQNLGRTLQERVKAITSIADLGLEVALDLPRIVVLGDQSAGKSSLIEGISGISVPRSGGTCTRCPIQINLQTDNTGNGNWSCNVELVSIYSYSPDGEGDLEIDIGPWRRNGDNDTDICHFKELKKKRDLPDILTRAQLALLNPAKNPAVFLQKNCPQEHQVDFSPNLIRLTILAAELPNLSLYDLPGVINPPTNAVKEDEYYIVDLVKRLANHYINQPNTVIMLALAMNVDPQNSTAATLVKNAEARSRTIGVFTKPDQLPEGDKDEMWISMMAGAKFQLGYGYFVTKQLSQEHLDRGLSHDQARVQEQMFFDGSKRWNSQFKNYKSRQGTLRLQQELSRLLALEISKSLPRIDGIIAKELSKQQDLLQDYPAPTQNSLTATMRLVERFRHEISAKMSGEPDNSFICKWRELMLQYRQDLVSLKPMVVVKTPPEESWRSIIAPNASRAEPISIDDEEDEEGPSPNQSRKRHMTSSTPSVQNKRLKSSHEGTPTLLPQKFTLSQVRQTVHDSWMGGIPNANDPRADALLIAKSMSQWGEPLEALENQMSACLRKQVGKILDELLRPYASTALNTEARTGVGEHLESIILSHHKNATQIANAEYSKHTTFNEELLDFQRGKELGMLVEKRQQMRARIFYEYQECQTGKRTNVTDLERKLGEDPHASELQTIARVRGYFNVASMTTVDTIGKLIHLQLFVRCKEELADHLQNYLRLNDRDGFDNCERLLTQDSGSTQARNHILHQIDKLDQARQFLKGLHEK